jgi:hypothetical protein
MVTAKDIDYLLRGLFGDDWHDYKHERARVQVGSALALFSGSGARAGAVVESSAYRHSNECLYYRVGLSRALSSDSLASQADRRSTASYFQYKVEH